MDFQTIDLFEIAHSGTIGPLVVGKRLSDFADIVGPPSRWGAFESVSQKLNCVMAFGLVEVGFVGAHNDLVISWVKIRMADFKAHYLNFCRPVDGVKTRIYNPFPETYPSIATVRKAMAKRAIDFRDGFPPGQFVDAPLVLSFGKALKFYFDNDAPEHPLSNIWMT